MKDNFGNTLTKDSDNLNESLLLDKKRQELITQGRKGANYALSNQFRGKNRFERKKYSKVARNVSQFNDIDMNAFFKKDILTVGIRVQGETDYYIVKIKFEGVLKELQRYIKQNNNKFEYKVVLQALTRVFNTGDIYVNCTCLHPDTPIKLLDGTTPTVSEMKERFDKGEKLWVYSTDSNGDFKPGEVEKVWITNETDKFIKVTLDNGQSSLTTPEHLYMLGDGSYACACDLQVGQALMPSPFIITKIEQIALEEPIPVYDIKVKDWENFVVGQGVVLHNCPDFKFRFDFWSTVNNYNSGNPQNIPAKITNPNNTKGSGCKHVLLVLANVEWLLRVASVINNYVNYAETHLQKLYADYIFPQIYGVKYSKEVQLQLTDTDEVTSDKELIDIANRLGRNRGRFSSTYQPDRAKGRNAFKKQIAATVEPKGNVKSNFPQKEESGSNTLKSGKNNNATFTKKNNKKDDSIEPMDEK